MSHSVWDPSSLTRDQTHVPCKGSMESWTMYCQGIPFFMTVTFHNCTWLSVLFLFCSIILKIFKAFFKFKVEKKLNIHHIFLNYRSLGFKVRQESTNYSRIQLAACFCKWKCAGPQPWSRLSVYCLWLLLGCTGAAEWLWQGPPGPQNPKYLLSGHLQRKLDKS